MNGWKRVTVVLAVGAVGLVGCGRSGNGGDAAVPSASAVDQGKASGKVNVWAMGTEGEKLNVLAKDFMAANPDAKVMVTAIPWDAAHDKIASAIAGGQTPDVSLVGTTWMGEFAATGALDPTPPDIIDSASFYQGAWDSTVVDNTSFGVPWYVETRLLYYRTDLAKKAGITAPPASWDELKTMAKAMQDKAGAKYGISLPPGGTGAWQTFMPFAWQNGAELVQDGKYALDDDAMKGALDYYDSFFSEGLSSKALEPGVLEQGFVDGSIGSFFSGPWHIGILDDQGGAAFKDKYAVAHMPKQQSATSFVGGGDLVVFKDAENRDAAWKFVAYLSQPDVQQKWYGTVKDLPSVKSAWDSGELATDKSLAAFGKQLDDAKSPPAVPTWEQVAAVIDRNLEQVIIGGTDPAQGLSTMQRKATSIGLGG